MGDMPLNKKPTAEDFAYAYVETSDGAIVRVPKANIFALGKDGGYYTPTVDANGNLTWTASAEGMPEVAGTNIKGPKGDTGYTPQKGTDYFTEADKEELVNMVLEALPAAEEVAF